ncbi:hypothetical protein LEP1GSC103_2325 [Leptospira borgpetersenii serovar Javanica str. UI 09931]|uniref:Uncharacterized protein n=3 Tax=Leptospira borgpetersenii TaxID=174 RepID=M3FGV2_LEPBO|nr:hypothetical protein LEP1GSC128_3825 [Leptospira borgpetersenii str. 200801926]EKQ93875.1 hypothetical protein LEP1GSC101_1832 [Leptospira borgpetersenii str. UI 09149]EMG01068.1 hypothetical protein LEP1GSC123_1864 [Leptospira borgpetersenii str. 200701203]EMK10629.1 hypothetical protein LEP1GSC066_2431 [Leptospira sp. serovar Kenya str. Sh9]EMN57422.1 hypothetical protein LEP1GSC090_2424 [Leptospira borgpetersenii serovar Javanica str. MK146]ENO65721.1 hypothetical protein LEP1GSC191_2303
MIYGFSNGFYCWNTFVGVPTSEVLGRAPNILRRNSTWNKIYDIQFYRNP